jgi:hypothetical protein
MPSISSSLSTTTTTTKTIIQVSVYWVVMPSSADGGFRVLHNAGNLPHHYMAS